MVNKDRVRRKLPELLVDGPLTERSNLYEYQSTRRKLRKIERRREPIFNHYLRKIVKALDDFERAMNEEVEF